MVDSPPRIESPAGDEDPDRTEAEGEGMVEEQTGGKIEEDEKAGAE